jgi:hypothetical protein
VDNRLIDDNEFDGEALAALFTDGWGKVEIWLGREVSGDEIITGRS